MPESGVTISYEQNALNITNVPNTGIMGLIFREADAGATEAVTLLTSVADTSGMTLSDECQYQIDEFFRINPRGKLWFQMVNADVDADTITAFMRTADLEPYGLAICSAGQQTGTLSALITIAATAIAEMLADEKTPMRVVIDSNAGADASFDLVDGSNAVSGPTLDNDNYGVFVIAGGDADQEIDSVLMNAVGTFLGVASLINISTNPAAKSPEGVHSLLDGVNFLNLHIGGQAYKSFNATQRGNVSDAHLIYPHKVAGLTGVYFENSFSMATATSDLDRWQFVGIFDHATRLLNPAAARRLSGKLAIDPDTGLLAQSEIDSIVADLGGVIEDGLVNPGHIIPTSDPKSKPYILVDRAQNVQSTGTVAVGTQLVRYEDGRQYNIKLAYATTYQTA